MNKTKDLTVPEAFALAAQYHQGGSLETAANLYNEILKVNPKHAFTINNLGLIFKENGDIRKAIRCYEKAIEIDPKYADVHNNLGVVFKEVGEIQKAKECYEKAIAINPNSLDAYNNLGVVFKEVGEIQKAKECYEKAIAIDPNYSNAHNNLGVMFFDLDEAQKAISCYEKAIKANPNHTDAYNNLGAAFKEVGEYQKSLSHYEKVIDINPDYIGAHYNLGVVFQEIGEYPKAIIQYEKAIKADPKHIKAHNNLGAIFNELGDNKKAIDCYEKVIAIDPNNKGSLYSLGVVLFSIKQYKKAIEKFKSVNFRDSKSFLLNCFYKLDDKSNFFKQLDDLIIQGQTNAIIGSLTSRSEIKYGVKKVNLFCDDPLKYAVKINLTEQCDFNNIFAKPIKNVLEKGMYSARPQELLTNGHQTAGNLFNEKNDFLDKIKNIIHLEVDKYYDHFKESKEGFIKNWPKSYNINAWLVIMKNGGKLAPHMHDYGWLSGSIYINVPPKSKTDSGNLVVCIDEQISENDTQKKVMDVVTGSLCLFPSSLYHYTIPFESGEERIVLAFDILPT